MAPEMEELVKWLKAEVKQEEGTAEECVQELDNVEEADRRLAKAEAYKDAINKILSV